MDTKNLIRKGYLIEVIYRSPRGIKRERLRLIEVRDEVWIFSGGREIRVKEIIEYWLFGRVYFVSGK